MQFKGYKVIEFVKGLLSRLFACNKSVEDDDTATLEVTDAKVDEDDHVVLTLKVKYKDARGAKLLSKVK